MVYLGWLIVIFWKKKKKKLGIGLSNIRCYPIPGLYRLNAQEYLYHENTGGRWQLIKHSTDF